MDTSTRVKFLETINGFYAEVTCTRCTFRVSRPWNGEWAVDTCMAAHEAACSS